MGRVTILELRAAYPHLFCPGQVWYDSEPFAARDLPPLAQAPTILVPCPSEVCQSVVDDLTDAVLLVQLYVTDPGSPIFADYLWTADTDRQGQRVYVGGTRNGRGLELHRHIHLTERFAIPLWH